MARLEKEAHDKRARHKRTMAEQEMGRREILRNKKNNNRLFNLLAELKEVRDDMINGSDEEVAPQAEVVATSVKSEGDSVDGLSSAVPCSAIVGGMTGSVVLGTRATRPFNLLVWFLRTPLYNYNYTPSTSPTAARTSAVYARTCGHFKCNR